MVSYVTDDMTDADTWTAEQIEAVAVALAADAAVFSDEPLDAAVVEQGRALMADEDRCGSCHHAGENETDLGAAPDLVGWGSREWLIGIISDPNHERFYPDTNDRMPSFGVAEEGGVAPLSSEQIALLANWLRGEWYRGE
jgi:mono/diheme cytochrome c family protein